MSACSNSSICFTMSIFYVHFLCPFYNERQKPSLLDYFICSMQKGTVFSEVPFSDYKGIHVITIQTEYKDQSGTSVFQNAFIKSA